MERKKFIKSCCALAIGVPLSSSLLQSCTSLYYASTIEKDNKLILKKSDFQYLKKDRIKHRTHVLVKHPKEEFPICVFKTNESTFTASLMYCTHQGCETHVQGNIFVCPCHGSEFSTTGNVLKGPADRNLTTFETKTDHENIYIYIS